ncbi:bifunctional glutamate N-acetyltransferase/amino-acid acetyltransferase ArgJ [Thiomicrospira sp. WB1]|uniref:bifunctional glutamate N-acetyltransferase/amino-acid acetyltransferase ArgJ n=1 Tax=Thiomicrospira sp. WB1 TaxID=1685380 RepID=UPI0007493274|nr:bifunctional glutamate N-acetyltransferase/amino-acid acetyltransferase ArgJ [Thiomicrospira sp. WB1]KUJ71408.1 ornithine acetyltransferase [Thiomicrospira sp. WB1]
MAEPKEQTDTGILTRPHPIAGVYLGATASGLKKTGALDLAVMQVCEQARTAAVFTRNAFSAAPVVVAKKHLSQRAPLFLLINSGNANAGNGQQGLADAEQTCQWLGQEMGMPADSVLPFSTGVIGEPLKMDRIQAGLPDALADLSIDGWERAAEAIRTTDTYAKVASLAVDVDGHRVLLTGMAKGSGMIHPNMATMLGFVATDAKIDQACLDLALKHAADRSFNRITIDGDTSTNDACTLTATAQADMPWVDDPASDAYRAFEDGLVRLMQHLAHEIVRDGEGATKFVAVQVERGVDAEECLQVAHAVALSPLVKTALFACDPNWGRILAAVGRAGVGEAATSPDFDIDAVEIYLGNVLLVANGGRAPSYTEAAGQAVMDQTDITIRIVLHRGAVSETVWTSDFSYDYVKINAEYRT